MQAWFCETLDGPDALTWKQAPTPEPGKGLKLPLVLFDNWLLTRSAVSMLMRV